MVTVMMIRHIRTYVSLIVVQINRLGFRIVRWEIPVVIRRRPSGVMRIAIHIPHRRTFDEYRPYDIVGAIQIAVADYLHIQYIRPTLCH